MAAAVCLVQRPVIFFQLSGYRAPWTVTLEAALFDFHEGVGCELDGNCSDVFVQAMHLRVPGIGTIHGFWPGATPARSERVSLSSLSDAAEHINQADLPSSPPA